MPSFTLFALTTLLVGSHANSIRSSNRHLLESIAGYVPTTLVTDQNAIDQDQRTMETVMGNLSTAAFASGIKVYQQGGNSGSYAKLTLAAAIASPLPKIGDDVTGINSGGTAVTGKILEDYVAGSTSLKVAYTVSDVQLSHVACRVGGLPTPITTGCFAPSGTVKINNGPSLAYTYAVLTDNLNSRTLQSLSTTAASQQKDATGKYYPYYQKYVDYYGDLDYAAKIVVAAFQGTSVSLKGKVFDFVDHPLTARDQVIKKTSAYTTLVMVVLGQMERALENCFGNRTALAMGSLDQAVAYYTGSLEGTDGSGLGYTLNNHAEKRCGGFKTCGSAGDDVNGTAKVNFVMYDVFNQLKTNIGARNCAAAKTIAAKGMSTLLVPQIQGSLRYLRVLASRTNYTGHEGPEAEGAAFSAGVLPVIAACNATSAMTIWNNLRVKAATPPSLANVKAAFESTYKCIGIKCSDVGGQWNTTTSAYIAGAEPCVDVVDPPTKAPVSAPVVPPASAPVAAPTGSDDDENTGFFGRIMKFFGKLFGGIFGIFS